jgi:DNA-binding MarR family transcriptional regulator
LDKHDLHTLQILEEIEKNHHLPTQRELARKLNVSLGLTNAFIKRLSNKGLFKVTNIPKNRIKYILTPKGFAEKSRLSYEYIQVSYQFYKGARHKLRSLFSDFAKTGVQRIVFYGVGELAEIAYISLQETTIHLVAIVDDNNNIGETFIKDIVKDPVTLGSLSFDKILITTIKTRDNILDKLVEIGVSKSKVTFLE